MSKLAESLVKELTARSLILATVESCTGGMIAAAITDIPGSSAVFNCGYITYANEAKTEMVGVSADLLETHGAVSSEVAEAMAQGALDRCNVDIAVSCTGIAGPDGGTKTKPVGLVYIGLAMKDTATQSWEYNFEGDRTSVRSQTVETALEKVKNAL